MTHLLQLKQGRISKPSWHKELSATARFNLKAGACSAPQTGVTVRERQFQVIKFSTQQRKRSALGQEAALPPLPPLGPPWLPFAPLAHSQPLLPPLRVPICPSAARSRSEDSEGMGSTGTSVPPCSSGGAPGRSPPCAGDLPRLRARPPLDCCCCFGGGGGGWLSAPALEAPAAGPSPSCPAGTSPAAPALGRSRCTGSPACCRSCPACCPAPGSALRLLLRVCSAGGAAPGKHCCPCCPASACGVLLRRMRLLAGSSASGTLSLLALGFCRSCRQRGPRTVSRELAGGRAACATSRSAQCSKS